MPTENVEFAGAQGRTLAARFDRPDRTPRATALLVHCFGLGETSQAAARIGRALADSGVAVLGFAYAGRGDRSRDVPETADIAAAARWLEGRCRPPALLIGHSLGWSAVLAAASDVASAKAVAVIGAPADPARRPGLSVPTGPDPGARLKSAIGRLRRPLLILHSPVDQEVGIANASEIFMAARHPRSFISLDTADHLLARVEDADYAAQVIAAWAGRYLPQAPATAADDGAVRVAETGAGKFQVEVSGRSWRMLADEPPDVGGLGSGPSPYELLASALGACTTMTLRLYAERKGWPLERSRVAVRHEKIAGQTPPDMFDRRIALEGPLDDDQTARLMEIAGRCPVHRTLESGARVVTGALESAPARGAQGDSHFRAMDSECRDADRATGNGEVGNGEVGSPPVRQSK